MHLFNETVWFGRDFRVHHCKHRLVLHSIGFDSDPVGWFPRTPRTPRADSPADEAAGLVMLWQASGSENDLQQTSSGRASARSSALDRFGFTILHCAIIAEAELKTVEELMQAYPGDATVSDKYGDTPLLRLLRPNIRKAVQTQAHKFCLHFGRWRRRGWRRYADAKRFYTTEPVSTEKWQRRLGHADSVEPSGQLSIGQRSMLSEPEAQVALALVESCPAALSITDRTGQLPIALALRQHASPALITRMALLDTSQSWPFLLQHENAMHYVNAILETVGASDDLNSVDTDPLWEDIRSSAQKPNLVDDVDDSANRISRCRRATMVSCAPTSNGRRINLEAIRALATGVDRACPLCSHCRRTIHPIFLARMRFPFLSRAQYLRAAGA